MPGGGTKIPMRCIDAAGRERVLFNPAVRRGEPPRGVEMPLAEWEAIRARLVRPWYSRRNFVVIAAVVALLCGMAVTLRLLGAQMSIWTLLAFTMTPLVGTVLLAYALVYVASRTWGIVAFTDVAACEVVEAMVASRRCPSCAYPLMAMEEPGELLCPECGGEWRESTSARN